MRVVPIPRRACRRAPRSNTAVVGELDRVARSAAAAATAARSASSAVALATSPARCPPIPSATAKSSRSRRRRGRSPRCPPGPGRRRWRPPRRASPAHRTASTTVWPNCTRSPLRRCAASGHRLAVERGCRWWSRGPPRTVAVAVEDPRVHLGDEGVVGEHDGATAAAADGHLLGDAVVLSLARLAARRSGAHQPPAARAWPAAPPVPARPPGVPRRCCGTGAGARSSVTTTRTTRNRKR